jgi:Protein of unknown function (DUF2510)
MHPIEHTFAGAWPARWRAAWALKPVACCCPSFSRPAGSRLRPLTALGAMPTFGAVLGGQRGNVFLAIFKRRLEDRPADWYPDPEDVARLRYRDGSDWTDQTAA